MPTCAIVSFRLGLTDGVSIVADAVGRRPARRSASTWSPWPARARSTGTVPGLAIDAAAPARGRAGDGWPTRCAEALADADLVVVENLCTIPLNLPAARAVAEVLAGRPAILHHHDPPWQRERFAHVHRAPARRPGVAPRHHQPSSPSASSPTGASPRPRSTTASTVDGPARAIAPAPGRGSASAPDELLVAHPVRAIARKDIAAGAARCASSSARPTGCSGAAEEGYGAELERILAARPVPGDPPAAPPRARHLRRPRPRRLPARRGRGSATRRSRPPSPAGPSPSGPTRSGVELRALGFEWFDADRRRRADPGLAAPIPIPDRRSTATSAVARGALLARRPWPPRLRCPAG